MSNAVKLAKAGKILAYIGIFSQSIAGLSMVMPKTAIIFVIACSYEKNIKDSNIHKSSPNKQK